MNNVSMKMLIISFFILLYGVLAWFLMGEIFTGNMEKGAKAISSALFLAVGTITISISALTMGHSDDDKKQSR